MSRTRQVRTFSSTITVEILLETKNSIISKNAFKPLSMYKCILRKILRWKLVFVGFLKSGNTYLVLLLSNIFYLKGRRQITMSFWSQNISVFLVKINQGISFDNILMVYFVASLRIVTGLISTQNYNIFYPVSFSRVWFPVVFKSGRG